MFDGDLEIFTNTAIFTFSDDNSPVSLPITNICDANIIRIWFGNKELKSTAFLDVKLNKDITFIPCISMVLFSSFDAISKYRNSYISDPNNMITSYLKSKESSIERMIISTEEAKGLNKGLYALKELDDNISSNKLEKFNNMRYINSTLNTKKVKDTETEYPNVKPILERYVKSHPEISNLNGDLKNTKIIFELGDVVGNEVEISHFSIDINLLNTVGISIISYTPVNKYPLFLSKLDAELYREEYKLNDENNYIMFNKSYSLYQSYLYYLEKKKERIDKVKSIASTIVSFLWNNKETIIEKFKEFKSKKNNNNSGKDFASQVADKVSEELNKDGFDCTRVK